VCLNDLDKLKKMLEGGTNKHSVKSINQSTHIIRSFPVDREHTSPKPDGKGGARVFIGLRDGLVKIYPANGCNRTCERGINPLQQTTRR
jgi:hypothetical protein